MRKATSFMNAICILFSACVMGFAILICVGNQGSSSPHGKTFEQGYSEGRKASDEEAYQAYLGIAQNAKAYKASRRAHTINELMEASSK